VWQKVYAQAQGAPADGAAPQGPQSFLQSPMIMIAAFLLIMYMFLLRPNQKREKERRAMLAAMAKGDQVVTTGGICGTIVGLKEKTVILCVDEKDNTTLELLRGAISQVVSRAGEKGENG